MGKRKVFVSGCYDMLHSGHVAFFEEASKLGDLYVGIGSDQTIFELKGRRTINPEEERLYMVKSLRCVKDAWINRGAGLLDFEEEVRALRPEVFFVNTDGFSPLKESFCRELGIELVVSRRIPSPGLPARSTTALRQECTIPFRVELAGGWLDQPFVNELAAGPVLTVSIEPDYNFNDRSGMATSSRKKAVELWHTAIPAGDREQLAKLLFCMDNPPGTKIISGSQDALGLLMPGLNKLNYRNGYWPVGIDRMVDPGLLEYVEDRLYLIQLPQRRPDYDVFAGKNVNAASAARLAAAAEACWHAILARDTRAWGAATTACLAAQLEMFPNMQSPEMAEAIDHYRNWAAGWKITGCGGGGYLVLIAEKPIPNAIKIRICRS